MPVIATQERLERIQINDYKRQQRNHLLTSRFNDETWSENEAYRKKNNNRGCIYCAPDPISNEIPSETIMFILEMNNDRNQIMGIGMVRNRPYVNKYKVYGNGNYNRYVFTGKERVDRKEMTESEEEVMQAFDILCFTGRQHMKRGQGLKRFPTKILYRCNARIDLVDFIRNMFKERMTEKTK
tara:strand:- start:3059 stop:3607 length:549 start_codon:yes stop_codon:yes gene_type:complete